MVAVIGLVVAGLGYGTHYPLSVSLVLRAAGARPDHAQGLGSLGVGMALGIAPFLLGTAADAFGTHRAFLLVGLLIACGGIAVAFGLRSVHRARQAEVATEVGVPVGGAADGADGVAPDDDGSAPNAG